MSASLGGHAFFERGNAGYDAPGFDRKYVTVTKIIPNGSPVVQSIGADVARLAMPIRCTAAQLSALYGDVDGDTHTLTWSGGSDSVLLESIATPTEVKPGVDMYNSVLSFIKV